MRFRHPYLRKALGLGGAFAVRLWRETVDWQADYFDPTVDPVHPRYDGRHVFCCWHEYLLMPIVLRGDRRLIALTSQHTDGEILSRVMRHLGWGIVQGSTTRGGTAALLRVLRRDKRHPNLSPDGPRGPHRRMSLGAVFLASRLSAPLVCVGYGYDRPWRLSSWDCFAIPRPFSRARAILGPPVHVPPTLDRQGLEQYRGWCEQLLEWLTEEAETWAASGRRRPGGMAMLPREPAPPMLRGDQSRRPTLPDWLLKSWPGPVSRRPTQESVASGVAIEAA
jgi:lysophospholipid acyltransferase (LPLAT)-like uncharacterized protein